MKYSDRIIQLLTRFVNVVYPSEEDRLWNAWLDIDKIREPCDDLQSILTSDVRKEFKARALIVLLAPDLRVLPFRWDDVDNSICRNYLNLCWLKVKAFPPELMSFAGELVCQNIDYAHSQKDRNVRRALFEYNKLILQFLAVIPEDDELANQLFSRYQINDPVSFWNIDEASGYNPLCTIFCAEDVPTKWKVLADKQMRDRIVAEVEGCAQPREDWEVALRCYTDHIQMSNYDGREGYSRGLLASQIRFITELSGIEGYSQELFNSRQLGHIMEAIPGDAIRETRHKLARLVVLRETEEHSRFSVFDPKSRRVADLMLREFGAEDQDLFIKLNAMIAEANRREVENSDTQLKQREKINKVLNQMK